MSNIVILNEEGYSERKLSENLNFSKTAIYQAVVLFRKFGSFQELNRAGRPKITNPKNDHEVRRM